MNKIRQILRGVLMACGFLRTWVRWKTGKLVELYKALLLRSCQPAEPTQTARPVATGHGLRKLLFIADNMWERQELLPELARICEFVFVDVHPHIRLSDDGREYLPAQSVIAELNPHQGTRFDGVLVYLRSPLLSEELIGFLRSTWSCPLIGLNLDCKTSFDDYNVFRRDPTGYRHWAKSFDCNLTNARAMVDVYSRSGANCLYLPTGYHYDPNIHILRTGEPFVYGLSFVGSWKPERQLVIEDLKRIGINVEVFGAGWGNSPFVPDGWKIHQKTQLSLGIGFNVADTRITNLKNRDFECPGVGGCYLTTYDWELAELFQLGKEILCYRGLDDLVELYTYYIRRPEDCRRIAAAGFDRCRREHTWEHRFRKVFGEMGFKPAINYVERA
jgi:hypothetical protein